LDQIDFFLKKIKFLVPPIAHITHDDYNGEIQGS